MHTRSVSRHHGQRPVHRGLAALVLASALVLGACGDDKPSADDLGAEAKEQTGKAAEDIKDTAETVAEEGKDVAEDVADGPDDDDRHLAIVAPSDGATISGDSVELKLEVGGLTVVAADGDTSGKSGHFHVFVDQDPVAVGAVIPKVPGVVHSASNPVVVPDLSKGDHRLVVVVGDGAHQRLDFPTAEVDITLA